jgi:hypothetical protein
VREVPEGFGCAYWTLFMLALYTLIAVVILLAVWLT